MMFRIASLMGTSSSSNNHQDFPHQSQPSQQPGDTSASLSNSTATTTGLFRICEENRHPDQFITATPTAKTPTSISNGSLTNYNATEPKTQQLLQLERMTRDSKGLEEIMADQCAIPQTIGSSSSMLAPTVSRQRGGGGGGGGKQAVQIHAAPTAPAVVVGSVPDWKGNAIAGSDSDSNSDDDSDEEEHDELYPLSQACLVSASQSIATTATDTAEDIENDGNENEQDQDQDQERNLEDEPEQWFVEPPKKKRVSVTVPSKSPSKSQSRIRTRNRIRASRKQPSSLNLAQQSNSVVSGVQVGGVDDVGGGKDGGKSHPFVVRFPPPKVSEQELAWFFL